MSSSRCAILNRFLSGRIFLFSQHYIGRRGYRHSQALNRNTSEIQLAGSSQSEKPVRAIHRPASESELAQSTGAAHRFGYRALVVDDEPSIRGTVALISRKRGLRSSHSCGRARSITSAFAGLCPISSFPICTCLECRDSNSLQSCGKRLPHIPIIAINGEYSGGAHPRTLSCKKVSTRLRGCSKKFKKLLAASPIRAVNRKGGPAAFFVPKDPAGSPIITCPKCLRTSNLRRSISTTGFTRPRAYHAAHL